MVRVKRGNVARKRRKKYLKFAKGYRGINSRLSTFAKEQVIQSLFSAYKGRRKKKKFFRHVWIHRINAATRFHKVNYSSFLGNLRKANIFLNRKILAFFAFQDTPVFNLMIRKFCKQ